MRSRPFELIRDPYGTTAIEYALIASLIAVVIVGAVSLVGSDVSSEFNSVVTNFR